MNRETIIQIAREAGFDLPTDGDCFDYPLEFERFYALAVAKEREECAKWYAEEGWLLDEEDVPAAIRARGCFAK